MRRVGTTVLIAALGVSCTNSRQRVVDEPARAQSASTAPSEVAPAPSVADDRDALAAVRLAAERGDAVAQFGLARLYSTGDGVTKDVLEAVRWYRLAAEQDYAPAQFNLGVLYRDGVELPQDTAEAAKWYRLAAEQGNARAQANLGVMCAQGYGVPRDDVQAHVWFSLAAANGAEQARDNLPRLERRMTAEQVAEARRRSQEFRPRVRERAADPSKNP